MMIGLMAGISGCSPKLKPVTATSQKWYGGAAGSGGGVNYAVSVTKPEAAKISVDKIWLGDNEKGIWADFSVWKDSSRTRFGDKVVPESVSLFQVKFEEVFAGRPMGPGNRNGEPPSGPETIDAPEEIPGDFQGKALIFLTQLPNKTLLIPVEQFTPLQPIAYP